MDRITSIITYFAKFPPRATVLKNFVKQAAPSGAYTEFKAAIEAMPEAGILPTVTDYVFGTDEERLSGRLKNAKNTVLFVEIGRVVPTESPIIMHQENRITVAVTVGSVRNQPNTDDAEEITVLAALYEMLQTIIAQAVADRKECALLKGMEYPTEIYPVPRGALFEILGWTAFFDLKI